MSDSARRVSSAGSRGKKKKASVAAAAARRAEAQARADVVAATFANTELVSAKEALESYHGQFQRSEAENAELRRELSRQQDDAMTVVEHLQQQLDEVANDYAAYRAQVSESLATNAAAQAQLEARYQEALRERDAQIAELLALTGRLQEDLAQASRYVQQRQEHAMELRALQDKLEELSAAHEKELTALRFQTIDRKMRLVALEKTMSAEFRATIERESQRLLEDKHGALVSANAELLAEKAAMLKDINDMIALSRDLNTDRAETRRRAELSAEAQREVMRRAAARARLARDTGDRAAELEGRLREARGRERGAVAAVRAEYEGRVAELEAQLAAANAAVGAHRKELQQMRALAGRVVEQRSDLERFFYVALADCRRYRAALEGKGGRAGGQAARRQGPARELPPVRGGPSPAPSATAGGGSQNTSLNGSRSGAAGGAGRARGASGIASSKPDTAASGASEAPTPSPSPPPPGEGAYIDEMSWEDKEKVIKALLFYINSTYYSSGKH